MWLKFLKGNAVGLALSVTIFFANGVSAFEMKTGDGRNSETGSFQDGEIASKLMAAKFYGMSGFASLDDGASYYALLRTAIARLDMGNGNVLGSWPLTRWENEFHEPELIGHYSGRGLDYRQSSKLEAISPGFLGNNLGCYPLLPVRYGDVNNDGRQEIILFIGYDFLVFSPQEERVIFGQRLRQDEWLDKEVTEDYFLRYGRRGEHLPQYQSSVVSGIAGHAQGQVEPGLRGYAKLYTGKFSGADAQELLVWRKLYVSHLVSDEAEGFRHLRDTLLHYIIEEGEYQLQETGEEAIRSWLTANDLTWQSGFPTYSECPGEEGELIPEMHDPLLNDPDVLK